MHKKRVTIIGILFAVIVIAAGLIVASNTQTDTSNNQSLDSTKTQTTTNEDEGDSTAADTANNSGYITLANYDQNQGAYADVKKVYFFHASWCSICQGIEKEIIADVSRIPDGVVLIKTDFDTAIDLRKKYGVTYQYTFVQIDNNGNEIAQWSATSLDKAINGIKS
jgi:thiol-disulfide isomerase/thioredoxin